MAAGCRQAIQDVIFYLLTCKNVTKVTLTSSAVTVQSASAERCLATPGRCLATTAPGSLGDGQLLSVSLNVSHDDVRVGGVKAEAGNDRRPRSAVVGGVSG